GNKNLILYYGTLVRKKGVLELPYIFNRVIELNPNAKLLLLGKDNLDVFEGKPTWELFQDKLSEQSKLSVQYLSEIPYKEVKHYIEQSQVVVLPSYAEAFPMTWLETLAMEKPLVSSNIGWAKELMIDGLTGFTVNPRNHNHYADKIVALLRNPALCEQLGKAGRKHVEQNFSTKKIIPQNIEFYERVIHQYT
ncbi:MAG: glycosyltransferase family 4 protein, partial [Mangrovimonas sp.]|nr:glycosyltransferase family 4 protein [Mangrovimonas sp.]